ncbi:MAG: NAD(P)/FAD-dependent oxidoreductase [Candidatus Omnitrophota bacterium]|nr:NAD(P)/FAD-dependent oxidoreductase [Candidatus Omnitrophota bacterium]
MKYDVAIIGAGAAGIACAKQAAKYKLSAVLFERSLDNFGGTCLNKGCIPTKFFLNSSKLTKSWHRILEQKNSALEKIKQPTLDYLKRLGIDILFSEAKILDGHIINADGKNIEARNIIIATGSLPRLLIENEKTIFAQDLFSYGNIPDKFLIVGAGYIGIEFASLLNNLGKDVTVIEKENTILPFFDSYLANRLRIVLEKKGIKIETEKDIHSYKLDSFDKIILSAGREPNTKGLGLEHVGIKCDDSGWVMTDEFMRTNIKNIYACGDINGKKLLAYVAQYQAKICLDNIIGKKTIEDYRAIADCVFSFPQIAKVGILEEEAKSKKMRYEILKSNFLKFSSAHAYGDTDGFMQVIVGEGDVIIGAGIISNLAAELINIFSLAIKNKLTSETVKSCVFVHPTLSEIIPFLFSETE